MSIGEFVGLLLPLSGAQVLVGWWIKARLEASIKHEYDTSLEHLRYELRQREQAAMIAELFAEWAAEAPNPERKRLNQLAWQAGLWLPPEIVKELAKTLTYAPGHKTAKEVLALVRHHMKGRDDGVTAGDFVHF